MECKLATKAVQRVHSTLSIMSWHAAGNLRKEEEYLCSGQVMHIPRKLV